MNTRTTKTAPSGKVEHANFAQGGDGCVPGRASRGRESKRGCCRRTGRHRVRTYRYAGLPDISAAALPALGRHGLSFVTRPLARVDAVRSLLRNDAREAGRSLSDTFPLPDPMTTPADEFGYQVSRARRIALCAITGVAPGGSDEATRQATSEPQAAAAPTRDWIAEAGQFDDPEQIKSLWHELRDEVKAGRAKQATLDAVAELARQATPAADEPEPSS